jgi:hypothetical protein
MDTGEGRGLEGDTQCKDKDTKIKRNWNRTCFYNLFFLHAAGLAGRINRNEEMPILY